MYLAFTSTLNLQPETVNLAVISALDLEPETLDLAFISMSSQL